MKRFLSLLVLTAAACGGNEATEVEDELSADIAAALATPIGVTLAYGEYKRVVDARLGVAFNRVLADSRCPIDAVCVRMGDAIAELELTVPGGRVVPIQLHTSTDPKSASVNGVKVTLLELTPAPQASQPTRPRAYGVRLEFEKASR